MKLLLWGLFSGLLVSIIVTWWPPSWQYAPGIIFGITIALYFIWEGWRTNTSKSLEVLKMIGFVGFSYLAYSLALIEAEWVLGTNGFATFSSYASHDAISALFVGCFVGGCIGTFILMVGLRIFFIQFDLIKGLFFSVIFSAGLGSAIVVGFEIFGFIPQFLFPAWHLGVAGVLLYLRSANQEESLAAVRMAN